MRAELKSLDCSDAPEGLKAFRPSDPQRFLLSIAATVGRVGVEGGELFYFHVCTGEWLAMDSPPKGFEFLHGHLLVDRWDYQLVRRAIGDLCFHAEGAIWDAIAAKLRLYGAWEFEGYREAT